MIGYDPAELIPPADDEIEFSLFGPGFGECAVCHLGAGDWLIVDSCLDPQTRTPVALQYLERLGVAPATSVSAVVATHWHDDHIQGMADVLKSVPSAKFAMSSAFGKEDFCAALAPWLDGGSALDGKGLAELRRIIAQKRSPTLAGENKIIHERFGAPRCIVRSLSPSDPAALACISELMGIPKTQFSTRMPSINGNHASVVISIEVGNRHLLLGGDLQARADRKFGWLAVVDAYLGSGRPKHHVYKIPHHGSANGDHPEIWEHLLVPEPHAVLARTGN